MTAPLRCYSVYGACLSSAVEFPELHEIPTAAPRWTFQASSSLPPMEGANELGSDRLYADVHARLFAHREGHRITVDDTGSFELSADRRLVTWQEHEGAWPDFVRAHLMGRVLATALYLDGLLPLHGSAVLAPDGVIAFLAPKGFGKSTLALTLTERGAPLVTDDTLPVEITPAPRAWPGVHSLRVHDDSIAALGVARPPLETREGKRFMTPLGDTRLMTEPAPLRAIYLLDPRPADVSEVERSALPPMLAALGVVAHVKIGRMLGAAAAAPMLERAAAIAGAVPVFRLHMPRDLSRLPAVAERILDWHQGPST